MEEGHGVIQQGERVALGLAVVEKLGFVRALEAGQPEFALRIAEHRLLAKQDDGGVEDLTVLAQRHPVQNVAGVSARGFGQASSFDAKADGAEDFLAVEVFQADIWDRGVFPARASVGALQEQGLVAGLRHDRSGGADALIRSAIEGVRASVRSGGHSQHEHIQAVGQRKALLGDEGGRFEAGQRGGGFAQRTVGNLLAHDAAFRRDAEKDAPTLAVQESTKSFARAGKLGGGFLELHRLGFTGGDDLFQFWQRHSW